MKSGLLREAGAALLFAGSLLQQYPELPAVGAAAIRDLAARGYRVPASEAPVRVYPAVTAGDFSSRHGAGWRPGAIFLRPAPAGGLGMGVYLRHELMHEASFLTCGGKLPLWAEEAAAMSFSGELADAAAAAPPTARDLQRLRAAVGSGAAPDAAGRRALAGLIARGGWPAQACAMSGAVEKQLGAALGAGAAGSSHVLVSLLSGRVLEAGGDMKTRYPPGSLLKVPYAAALREAGPAALGEELAASDTVKLLCRKGAFDLERYRLLLATVKDSALGRTVPAEQLAGADEAFWRRYLGERGRDGDYPYLANLQELAWTLRAALLANPGYFSGLADNGVAPQSTLYAESEVDKRVLRRLRALAKTGTASDPRGQPLVGHLLVAWPAESPVYLALFRQIGGNGAANLHGAARKLEEWSRSYPVEFAKVRVRLLTLVPRSSWEIVDECPAFDAAPAQAWTARISLCGRFRLVSSARGSRSERLVAGVLQQSAAGAVVLETDAETYADAVLTAEAAALKGAARAALRAVIVWNGSHGARRHPETASLCDHTHCMVFQGAPADQAVPARVGHTDAGLLAQLDAVAAAQGVDWLPFAQGGDERWERRLSTAVMAGTMHEPQVLDLRRERRRSGEVFVRLSYANGEEVLPCEAFRAAFRLPSCPESIEYAGSEWQLQGIGAGHGLGLSVSRAQALAQAGQSAAAILRDAYPAGANAKPPQHGAFD